MGMHGHREVNKALEEADLLVNIGARFDDRATGKISGFAPNAEVVHVDIDPAEIGKNVRHQCAGRGRCERRDRAADLDLVEQRNHDEWVAWIESQRNYVLEAALEDRPATPEPYTIIKAIAKASNGEAIYSTDVGQHQMWAAQHLGLDYPEPVAELRRSGNDGLRSSGCYRRQDRLPG